MENPTRGWARDEMETTTHPPHTVYAISLPTFPRIKSAQAFQDRRIALSLFGAIPGGSLRRREERVEGEVDGAFEGQHGLGTGREIEAVEEEKGGLLPIGVEEGYEDRAGAGRLRVGDEGGLPGVDGVERVALPQRHLGHGLSRLPGDDEQPAPPLRLPGEGVVESPAARQHTHVEPVGGEIEGRVPRRQAEVVERGGDAQGEP